MNKCLYCNKETNNPKFCSRNCAASFNNKIPKRIKKLNYCLICNKEIITRRKYCLECNPTKTNFPVDMTLKDAIYTKHHKSSAFALVRNRARAIMLNEPQICTKCGYNKHVEVCHIKPIKDFSENTLLSVINNKSNLILLCPNCHWEFDNL